LQPARQTVKGDDVIGIDHRSHHGIVRAVDLTSGASGRVL
jgi:hypothetical protein